MGIVPLTPSASPTIDRDLNAFESEVIEFFVAIARLLAQPRSVAEIYGLLFISEQPLTMAEIIDRLKLSKGSASQGLRFLLEMHAIRKIQIDGDRSSYFAAETVLKRIVGGFLREEVEPHLTHGHERLDRMQALLESDKTGTDFYQQRLQLLAKWNRRGGQLLPVIRRFLGG